VIGHDYGYVQVILGAVIVKTTTEHDVAGPAGEDPAILCNESDEVRLGIALQMREIAAVERHLSSPTVHVGAGALTCPARVARLILCGHYGHTAAGLRPAGQVRHLPLREHWRYRLLAQGYFLPAYFFTFVLFVQPFLQGGEIFQDGSGIYLAFAG